MRLLDALAEVRISMIKAAEKSAVRRLEVIPNSPCKKGCSACCSRMIILSLAEAVIIQEHLSKSGKWEAVRTRAETLMPLMENANPVSWFQMNQACPVLNPQSGACEAYEVRPTPCSTHYVNSDPKLCDPWSTQPGLFNSFDFVDIHEEFRGILASEVHESGMLAIRMPLPAALLLAEKLQKVAPKSAIELSEFIRNELR